MRRVYILLLLCLASAVAQAKTYSVADIPNVHVADSSAYVSNPDGIISEADVIKLNAMMRHIRRSTSAEAVVVAVDDIEGGDIATFATELFEHWGLGKSDNDNGLLVLLAKDLRRVAIRPGYGLEGVLPDITCAQIARRKMFPLFKEGDYGAGLVAGCNAIEGILTDPDAAEEIRSRLDDADFARSGDSVDFFKVYLGFSGLLTVVLVAVFVAIWAGNRKRSRHDRYVALVKLKPIYLALTFLGLFIPLAATLPLLLVLYRLRNAPHKCPHCGAAMRKVDEVHDNDYLNHAQDLEEQIGSVDYDVWLCPKCGETDIEQYVNAASGYRECENCHAHTARLLRSRILRQPTTEHKGYGLRDYSCLNCRHITSVPYELPVVVAVPIIIGGSGGGSNFGGGGGFGGGGFGGGHTGGGGFSGGW